MRGMKMCDVFSKPTRKKCHNIGSAKILESHQLYRLFLKSDRSFLNILNVILLGTSLNIVIIITHTIFLPIIIQHKSEDVPWTSFLRVFSRDQMVRIEAGSVHR